MPQDRTTARPSASRKRFSISKLSHLWCGYSLPSQGRQQNWWERSWVQNAYRPLGFLRPQFHQVSKRGGDLRLSLLGLWGIDRMSAWERALWSWLLHASEVVIRHRLNLSGGFPSTSVAAPYSQTVMNCGERLSLAFLGCFLLVSFHNGTDMSMEHKTTPLLQSVRAACTAYVRASKTRKESRRIPTINSP